MNDPHNFEPITPRIPEKPHGAILHFFDMTEQALVAMAETLSLSMGASELARIQAYFSLQRRLPTVEEIGFLDEIVRRRKCLAEAYRVCRTTKGHPHLSATREDLLQKLKSLAPSFSGAISLSDTAEVAARYLDRIGIGRELDSLAPHEKETETKRKLPVGLSLLLLLPADEMDNVSYYSALDALMQEPACRAQTAARGMVSEHGLAMTLAEITNGVCVGRSTLADAEVPDDEPLAVLHAYAGKAWMATHPRYVCGLIALAETYGLRAVHFATATASEKITLATGESPHLAVDLALLREFAALSFDGDFRLSASEEHTTPFFDAMYDATVAALSCYAHGCTDREAALAVTYRFAKTAMDGDALGRNLETILGVYRAQIELCITAESEVTFADDSALPAWTIAPLCPYPVVLPTRRQRADSRVYLVPICASPDGMPDFEACRALRRTLSKLLQKGDILSVAVADTDVLARLPHRETAVRGLLIESANDLPFAEIFHIDGVSFFEKEEEKTEKI